MGCISSPWVEEQALRSRGIVNSFITLALCLLLLFVSAWANTKARIRLEGSALPSSLVGVFAHCLLGDFLCWMLYSDLGP